MAIGYGAYIEQEAIKRGRIEGRKEGKAEGRQEGLKEGREKASEAIIMRMLQDGKLSEADIAGYADISIDKVRRIKAAMKLK